MNPQERLILSILQKHPAEAQAWYDYVARAKLDEKMSKAMRDRIVEMVVLSKQPATSHANEPNDKDLEIQALKTQLAASQEESTRKSMKLLEQHAKKLNDKNLVIGDLETRLSAAEQQTIDKLKVLEEQHVKQIGGMNLELQTLKTQQEQHVKELAEKDLVIQELKAHFPAAELQTVDKVMELTNENNRLSMRIQKLEESIRAERYLPLLTGGLQKQVHHKTKEVAPQLYLPVSKEERGFLTERRLQGVFKAQEALCQEKKNVVYKPTVALYQSRHESGSQKVVSEPTFQLHTELGKLYMELQEAKKPQEALMARLAVKDKEIECLMEQLKAKLAAKDSEIQNLQKMIQGGDEMNEKAVMADGQSE
ncbi:hypothetical protein GCK72_015886 [Caenorhabditis remanei]|uniref:Uncharacterized protein n=1 Tax=Caenorhabditis remanei TaxID=31234 RepID=A0A6A5GXQ7_CAERE|nr:hypothetical protein GCK72_015886 [Caenorhabditis remanei]KAF1759419.1 hypothetical protein GCK72_015886 [Caenorhabditis remanei]